MIKILVLIFSVASFAANEPMFIKNQQGGAKEKIRDFQSPNNLATKLGTEQFLVETGNNNILSNPSFEHSTFSTSWTNSAGTFTQETSVVIGGKASAKLVLSAQTMSLTQSSTLYAAQFSDGVQGLAMVRIKSGIALSVCSIQAGTVSTTNCVTTTTDSKWALYKVPFILGATSNGISIASSGSVTGTVYVDDAFVGATNIVQDIDQSRIAGESYWPVTATCQLLRASASLGPFNSIPACPAPTIVRSSMGTWLTTDADLVRQTINNLPAGTYNATFQIATEVTTGSITKFAINDGTTTCEAVSGNQGIAFTIGQTVSCTFNYATSGNRVFEIYGYAGAGQQRIQNQNVASKFILEYFGSGQTYSSQCGANCVDVFSAQVSSADAVSNENVDFINGSCTDVDAGEATCTFNTGIFTVAPNCTCSTGQFSGDRPCHVTTTSSVASVYTTFNGVGTNNNFTLSCQKQGADFVATRTIQGSFKEVMVATGVTKPKTCYYAFGGAAATLASPTVCSTGTCVEAYDSCGAITPPLFNSTGYYSNFTIANGTFANSSFIDCSCTAFDPTTGNTRLCITSWSTGDQTWQTTASGGFVGDVFTSNHAGTGINTWSKIKCEGSAP